MDVLRTGKQLWTLHVREEGEEKPHGKANSETEISCPVISAILLKANTNKKPGHGGFKPKTT